ncbi:MAG: sulfite exporter TauE/SafE family protein [Terriglobia bacterium]|jgi:sulfite exporter TauE/SafE
MINMAEALALGFGSGPICVASCGPVLLPWLGAEPRDLGTTGRLLAIFLGGRLAGYLAFAVVAWAAGLTIPLDLRSRALVFGLANFGLAALLGFSAWFPRRRYAMAPDERPTRLYQIGAADRFRPPAAVTLGFLTGLNLCPPFVAAGIRAAATHSLPGALAFFALFFAGTSVWFLPALAVSPLRRFSALPVVARMTMAALSIYYAYLGVVSVASWRLVSGQAGNLVISITGMVSHA